MAWRNLKTDWTANQNVKANFTDLNDIENDVAHIRDEFLKFTTSPNLDVIITNRTNSYIDYADSYTRIGNNIKALRDKLGVTPVGFIEPKTNWVAIIDGLTDADFNCWGVDLTLLYSLVTNLQKKLKYCNTFYARTSYTAL